jgi:hypothetical protein
MKLLRAVALMMCLPALLSLAACRGIPPDRSQKAFLVADDGTPAARFAPVFALERSDPPYNRIGTPTARLDGDGSEEVTVDPARATIYFQTQPVEILTPRYGIARESYTNLIYRIHFERVPGWHLTTGRNVGLLVIVTLNVGGDPVLVTTVHTCGCYLGFIPGDNLPPEAYPPGWPHARLVISIRAETHRVMDAAIEALPAIRERFDVQPATLQPMEALHALPLEGAAAALHRTTSFFYTDGCGKGYVKDSRKPFEMLFMGWLAMDFYVGRDKDLGDAAATGARVYTSIKFWNRRASDLYPFPEFLAFWGWRL